MAFATWTASAATPSDLTNLKSPTMMWDFFSLSPESLHQVTILFSDRGTPDGFRHMDGFSSHTFRSDQPEISHHDVGLLFAVAGIAASGHHPVFRSRDTGWLSPHGRLQQPHLQPD